MGWGREYGNGVGKGVGRVRGGGGSTVMGWGRG